MPQLGDMRAICSDSSKSERLTSKLFLSYAAAERNTNKTYVAYVPERLTSKLLFTYAAVERHIL